MTNLQEAVWDADIVVNGLPSTETRQVFEEISRYWKERITAPVIISLAKGIEAELEPEPRIITPTQMINRASKASFFFFLNYHSLLIYARCSIHQVSVSDLVCTERIAYTIVKLLMLLRKRTLIGSYSLILTLTVDVEQH